MAMQRFILSMPADLAAKVEAYRVRTGLISTAEAYRALLRAGLDSSAANLDRAAAFASLMSAIKMPVIDVIPAQLKAAIPEKPQDAPQPSPATKVAGKSGKGLGEGSGGVSVPVLKREGFRPNPKKGSKR